ncbi:MAG: hypothetical protein JRI23_27240 [Deltaproteobacteria bacterium]|jgi:hypothetical protein|nr:hypothetical protein [Deltaproteobacteria bacterium]MBW2535777.1 hypothetical protein [Deltaproteobacteria bacterium]
MISWQRLALGIALALAVQAGVLLIMSGCSLDWTVPETAPDASSAADGADGADAAIDHATDQSVDPIDADAADGPVDAPVDPPDALVGDAVVSCVEQPTCGDCVGCVLGELSGTGTSSDCNAYKACLLACAVWAGPGLDCVVWCADRSPAGFQVVLALNGTCLGSCGGFAPCE